MLAVDHNMVALPFDALDSIMTYKTQTYSAKVARVKHICVRRRRNEPRNTAKHQTHTKIQLFQSREGTQTVSNGNKTIALNVESDQLR